MKTLQNFLKSALLVVLVIYIGAQINAQPLGSIKYGEKTFGSGEAKRTIEVNSPTEGRFFMAVGSTGGNIALMKYTGDMDPVWRKTYGGPAIDEGNSLIQTPDGGYAIVGTTFSFTYGIRNILLLKVDGNGILEWSISIGGAQGAYNDSEGMDIILTLDSCLLISGSSHAFGTTLATFVSKISLSGVILCSKIYYGYASGTWKGVSVKNTSDNGFILATFGNATSTSSYDMGLLKLDSNLNIQWSKSYGGNQEDWTAFLALASDGYVLVGRTKSFGASGYSDILVVKTDFNGLVQWAEIVGDSNYEVANSVQISNDGEIIISGFVADSVSYDHNAYFLSLGSDGIPNWINKISNATNNGDYLYSTLITNDGFIFSGTKDGHFSILKVDGQGSNTCEQSIAIDYSSVTPVVNNFSLTVSSVTPTIITPTLTVNNWTVSVTTYCLNIVTNVNEINMNVLHNVFPNPATNYISVSGEQGDIFSLYNMTGQLVIQQIILNKEEIIHFNNLNSGMYIYVLGDKKGKLIVVQ